MRRRSFALAILILLVRACQSVTTTPLASTPEPAPATQAVTSTSAAAPATPTATPNSMSTPTAIPAGLIQVDTLEQEVYPFEENGKCSLAEAIYAANSGKPKDSCAAGVTGESVIELMPGEYRFTQRDQTPPQGEWAQSVVDVGDALPMVIYSLTIRGNGAILIRDESAESFRFFEVMFGTLTLEDLTLQNGDVGEDWGGAIYSMNASLDLKKARLFLFAQRSSC